MSTLTLIPGTTRKFEYTGRKLSIKDKGTFYLDRVYFISPVERQIVYKINREIYFYLNEIKISQINGDEDEFIKQYKYLKNAIEL